jgi:hypothetical protein
LKLKVLVVAAAALVLGGFLPLEGCGGREQSKQVTLQEAIDATNRGSYQVKATEDGQVRGVGIYRAGSFRVLLEEGSTVIIHNEDSGENWQLNLADKTYQNITYDQALMKAGFMPHLEMKGCFQLQQFWRGDQFRMDTSDGRSITAALGSDALPVSWQADRGGKAFKTIAWEYRRVGQVSPDNFRVPEEMKPKA